MGPFAGIFPLTAEVSLIPGVNDDPG